MILTLSVDESNYDILINFELYIKYNYINFNKQLVLMKVIMIS